MPNTRPLLLIILDGFGENPDPHFNAIAQAKTPNLNRIRKAYPSTVIQASEDHVGLPAGFMGNSEVGHLNIGAGRIVFQDFSLISEAIRNESFFKNAVFLNLFNHLKNQKKGGALHLIGLVSDGGVHSHLSHLFALLQLARQEGIGKVFVHVITDGRDTSPTAGAGFVSQLIEFCHDAKVGTVATVSGRFYAMDRDQRWERTERAYSAMVYGKNAKAKGTSVAQFSDPLAYIHSEYDKKVTDEFLPPAFAKDYPGMEDGDGAIFFNFRPDRARQLTRALTQSDFPPFTRSYVPVLCGFVCMTPYDEKLGLPSAYEKPRVPMTLGEWVSRQGGKQLRIAETEKYAHVTYFFNGGEERVFDGEKRVLIPSPREVPTYDLKPEMSAVSVTDTLLNELSSGSYQFVVVNFANPDMVGHTGNLRAAIAAVETVDACLGKIVSWVEKNGAYALLTSDHGNCEKMLDDAGKPLTAHTTLPVPFVLIDPLTKDRWKLRPGRLCDIAPTILKLWGAQQPTEMTGLSLVESIK